MGWVLVIAAACPTIAAIVVGRYLWKHLYKGYYMKPATGRAIAFRKSVKWIRNNRDKYQGCWIALDGGKLVGSDPSRKKVQHELNESGYALNRILFFKL